MLVGIVSACHGEGSVPRVDIVTTQVARRAAVAGRKFHEMHWFPVDGRRAK